jgi:hypothetical protein
MRRKLTLKSIVLLLLFGLMFGCVAINPPLKPVIISNKQDISRFKYFVITPSATLTSGTGAIYGLNGAISSKTISPSDLIGGILTKKNFIRLSQVNPDLSAQTMVVNFGESGRRDTGLGGYTIEVTIQFVSANSNEIISSCTAEGQGLTETDDVRIAVERCLNELMNK